MKTRKPRIRDPRQAAPQRAAPATIDDTVTATQAPGRAADAEVSYRQEMVAEAAYFRAEQRNFEPGGELDDWCAAEADIDAQLSPRSAPTMCGP